LAESCLRRPALAFGARISPWFDAGLLALLAQYAEQHGEALTRCAKRLATVHLRDFGDPQAKWSWHPALGFWRGC
jgi:hypothetical protein